MIPTLSLVLGALGLFIFYWLRKYSYWKRLGFPYVKPTFPFGNMKDTILFKRYQGLVTQGIYNELAPNPYGGMYTGVRPMLLIRDPEIIKRIMVKDFQHFRDRIAVASKQHTPLSQHLFILSGDKWRVFRTKLTPTFTSGKLKMMFGLFENCAKELDAVLKEKADKMEVVDIKELMARFTTDIIGTCAFGLEIKSMNDPDNEFRKIGQLIFPISLSLKNKIRLAISNFLPVLEKVYRFRVTPTKVADFILSFVGDTIEYREKNNYKRNDFMDLLIELKKKGGLESSNVNVNPEETPETFDMSLDDLASQCFVFFAAGFETSSSVLSYCLYELALHPDIQERLINEIDAYKEKHSGLTYQAIQEMPYLDQVVSETMRKYPTLPILIRHCTKPYTMPDSGLVVEKGVRILIPTYALHHDPKYFPEPEKFDPERFSPERKASIVPFTYLPFGEGPRICIGMRFGLLQTKMGICSILSNYKLCKTESLKVPLNFTCTTLISITRDPIILQIKHRNSA